MTKLMKRNYIEEMFFQPTTHRENHNVLITPEIAKRLLDNTNSELQRRITRADVLWLSDLMRNGHFKQDNGDTIRQDKQGNIIDGQHRLSACIEANFTFETVFAKGLDTDSIMTIDIGRKTRTYTDVLEITHKKSYKYAIHITGTVKFIHRFNKDIFGEGSKNHRNSKISTKDFLKWIDENPQIIDFVGETMRLRANGDKLVLASIFCGLKWALDKYNKLESDKFFQMLSDGIGLNSTSPIFMLRKRIMTSKFGTNTSQNRITQSQLIFTIIKTWNYYLDGKTTSIMQLAKKMPKIKTIKKLEF
tara:strand:- start:280 stop:1191 length:912 start_codon:yes stop_codon:yes gene_type:complete